MYVEVIPQRDWYEAGRKYFLHVCGGYSKHNFKYLTIWTFSPCMWRLFLTSRTDKYKWRIFSTYMEVILSHSQLINCTPWFLHVYGGYSWNLAYRVPIRGFLHVCGGYSVEELLRMLDCLFSHVNGCYYLERNILWEKISQYYYYIIHLQK